LPGPGTGLRPGSCETLTCSLINHLLLTSLNSTNFTNCPANNISERTAQKTPFLCYCIHLLPWKHSCLRSRYLVTAVEYLFISRSLPSSWSTRQNGHCETLVTPFHPFCCYFVFLRPEHGQNLLMNLQFVLLPEPRQRSFSICSNYSTVNTYALSLYVFAIWDLFFLHGAHWLE
jgi:hypothetical protein